MTFGRGFNSRRCQTFSFLDIQGSGLKFVLAVEGLCTVRVTHCTELLVVSVANLLEFVHTWNLVKAIRPNETAVAILASFLTEYRPLKQTQRRPILPSCDRRSFSANQLLIEVKQEIT